MGRAPTEKAPTKTKLVIVACVAALFATLFCCQPAFANESQQAQDSTSSQQATSTTVKVGYYESRNFQEGAEEGQPKSGYGYEYLQRMGSYAGWHFEYEYGTWNDLYQKLVNGEIDMMAGVSRSEQHEEQVLFPYASMLSETFYIYKNVNDPSMSGGDYPSFSGKNIGVTEGSSAKSAFETWKTENNCTANEKPFASMKECYEAFQRGEIDALVSSDNVVNGYTDIQPIEIVGKEAYYLAVSKQRTDLLSQANEVLPILNSLDRSFLVDLQSRYAVDTTVNAYLTPKEQEWTEAHRTLTVGYLNNYLPYCSTESDGSPTGLMVDVVPTILDKIPGNWSPEIEYRAFDNQFDLIDALKNGEVDLAFPVGGETWYAEQQGYLRSSSVASPVMDLVVPQSYNTENMASCIAINRNNAMQLSYVKTYFPNARIVECNTIEDCFTAVKSGRATSTVVNGLRATALLNSEPKLVAIQLPETDDRCFGVASGNGELLQLVNRGVDIVGSDYSTNASYAYTKELFKYTWVDFLRDNWVSALLISMALIALVAFLLVRRFRNLKSQTEHEAAMNKQLEDALAQAESANHAKDMLLRNLSHDIRTPLNGILGAMELNTTAAGSDGAKSSLTKARGASRQLVSLVDDLLEINTIRSGEVKLVEKEFFLADSVDKVMVTEYPFAEAANVHLELQALPSSLRTTKVHGSAEFLRKILANVIDNAVRYNKANGSVFVKADLSQPEDGRAQFTCTVKDTGIGMGEETLKRVSEPFFQADEGARSQYPGSGLGMSIVADLLHMMNGTSDIKSMPGKGTVVTLRIPFAVVCENCDSDAPSKDANGSVAGMHILLAEDNELNREVTQCILQQMGVEVTCACDGAEAVAMFKGSEVGQFDAILMDIMMPVMDGLEAAKAIRALDRADSKVPIIATTAKVTEEDCQAVFAAGMDDHLAKPLEPDALVAALLRHRRAK